MVYLPFSFFREELRGVFFLGFTGVFQTVFGQFVGRIFGQIFEQIFG